VLDESFHTGCSYRVGVFRQFEDRRRGSKTGPGTIQKSCSRAGTGFFWKAALGGDSSGRARAIWVEAVGRITGGEVTSDR
jgi:hypothetical protein